MPDLKKFRFGDLGTLFDGPHATPTRMTSGPYFLNIASLKSGRLDLSESDHISEEDFPRWTKRVIPREGDLLISYETRLGEAALMPPGVHACLGRRMALLRPHQDIVDPRFLLYYYLSPAFQNLILRNTIQGATVTRIGLKEMPSWNVEIPGLATQKAIAEVLGALDNKISANERVLQAADALVRGIVDQIADLVEVSELAWHATESVGVSNFAERVSLYSLPAFDDGQLPRSIRGNTIKSSKFRIAKPCVLFSKLNPRIPRIWDVVHEPETCALASTEFVVLEPRGLSTSLLRAAVSSSRAGRELANQVAGTSGSHQRVRPTDLFALRVPDVRQLPTRESAAITALGRSAENLRREGAELVRTRDELLPLLMSGRMHVTTAEREILNVV